MRVVPPGSHTCTPVAYVRAVFPPFQTAWYKCQGRTVWLNSLRPILATVLVSPANPRRIGLIMDRSCGLVGCGKPIAVTLGNETYCREHFMLTCYESLEKCVDELKRKDHENELWAETLRQSLTEIVDQATAMSLTVNDLSNLERSRLLDIVLWAGDLVQKVRCGARKFKPILVRLHFRASNETFAEEAVTREVSQHGTSLNCSFPVQVGGRLVIERMETGERVEAIVRWRHRGESGARQQLGIEILNCENFWRLDW